MVHGNARLTPLGRRVLVDRIVVEGWAVSVAAESMRVSRGRPIGGCGGSVLREELGCLDRSSRLRRNTVDTRLERLWPLLYLLVGDTWPYGNWEEIAPPCWARPDSPNCP